MMKFIHQNVIFILIFSVFLCFSCSTIERTDDVELQSITARTINPADCGVETGCILQFTIDDVFFLEPTIIIFSVKSVVSNENDTFLYKNEILNPAWYPQSLTCTIFGNTVTCPRFFPFGSSVTMILDVAQIGKTDSQTKNSSLLKSEPISFFQQIFDLPVLKTLSTPKNAFLSSGPISVSAAYAVSNCKPVTSTNCGTTASNISLLQRYTNCSCLVSDAKGFGTGDGDNRAPPNSVRSKNWFLIQCIDENRQHCTWISPAFQSGNPAIGMGQADGLGVAMSSKTGQRLLWSGMQGPNDIDLNHNLFNLLGNEANSSSVTFLTFEYQNSSNPYMQTASLTYGDLSSNEQTDYNNASPLPFCEILGNDQSKSYYGLVSQNREWHLPSYSEFYSITGGGYDSTHGGSQADSHYCETEKAQQNNRDACNAKDYAFRAISKVPGFLIDSSDGTLQGTGFLKTSKIKAVRFYSDAGGVFFDGEIEFPINTFRCVQWVTDF